MFDHVLQFAGLGIVHWMGLVLCIRRKAWCLQRGPAMLLGYVLAGVAVVVYAASGHQMIALVLIVAVTVFLIMLSLKTSVFSCSLASFNAYSCMFAGYYAGSFPKVESISLDLNNVLICVLWLVLANLLGLLCGYISVTVGNLGSKSK